jgi:undecaprenyl-diphosphatase
MLIVTGTMLESAELAGSYRKGTDEMTPKDSLIIGLMQAAAIAPGISRSGSTIATGLFLGFNREAAARFSFLLSIPIIAGAAAFDLRHGFSESGVSPAVLATGFMVSAVVGFIAIKFLMNYIRKHSLKIFAYYCWAIGAAVIIWHLVR